MKIIFILLIIGLLQYGNSQINDNITCSSGQFYNPSIKQCENCLDFCKQCINSTKCDECISGYISNPKKTICASMCFIGYFYNQSSKFCAPCDISCLSCLNETSCLTCNNNITGLIKNSTGLCVCPQSYYISVKQEVCLSCIENCLECSDNSTCNQCKDSYTYSLVGGIYQCIKECHQSQYFDKKQNKCIPCSDPNCISCIDVKSFESKFFFKANQCSECNGGFTIYQNTSCIRICSTKEYYNQTIESCQKCLANCRICNNPNTCIICQPLYELGENSLQCKPICMIGEFYNEELLECSICPIQCQTCSSANTCNSCNQNISGLIMSKSQKGACIYCLNNCLSCSKANSCDICMPPSYIWNQTTLDCQRICDTDQFYNTSVNQCVSCSDINCQKCSAPFECEECKSQFFLYKDICVRICPLEKYYNYSTKECEDCSIYCAYCENAKTCQQCFDGYQLNSSFQCIQIV